MAEKPVINIVGTRCQAGLEEKFNKWYNEVHIPLLLKFKGLQSVSRYKVKGDNGSMPEYIAIYEFSSQKDLDEYQKSPEFAAAIKEMKESWPQGFEITHRAAYEFLRQW